MHGSRSNPRRAAGPLAWLNNSRWVYFLFLVQVVAVLYFVTPSSPPSQPKPHHHGAHDPKDYSNNHNFIIIGILSDRTSSERRDAVRETWLRLYRQFPGKHHILHKFVIGQPYCLMKNFECDKQTLQLESDLEDEAQAYGDILRVNVLESYNTLSEKVCALVEWTAQQSFDYFLKTDHDIFLRLDTIAAELSELGPRDNYWRGFAWHDVPPISDSTDKNKELAYELGKFPPYTAGALHILSSNLVKSLASDLPRRYYQNEDQSLGIWLLPFNVVPIHDPRIQQWDVCHPSMIAKHPLTPERMRIMYDNVVYNRDLCQGLPDTRRCPLCFAECQPGQVHWMVSGLTCDERGASVGPALAARGKPAPLDSVMASVVGYLSFITCKRTTLEGPQPRTNFVKNGNFNKGHMSEWAMTGAVTVVDDGMVSHKGDPDNTCVKLSPSTHSSISYISQTVTLGQKVPEPIMFSAWCKADGVDETSNPDDISFLANIEFVDGTHFQGFTIHFEPGTHEWQHNVRVFNPERPIAKVEIFGIFRFHTGTIWFDNVSITKLSDGLCSLKFKTQFFRGFMPSNLNQVASTKSSASGLKFIVIWTTAAATFLFRHHRVIESIFYHHPDAYVKMYSNTLPVHFFHKFNAAGYNIEIIRYDIDALAAGLPGETWVRRISEWERGESFYAHLADYLRFVLLFREGGVYTDMDSILLRPVDETNIIGVEHCDQDTLDYCIYLEQFAKNQRYYLPIGFLVLAPSHPLIFNALSYFDTRYNPDLWPCGTVYLTLAYSHLVLSPRSSATENGELVRILPREAFYPIAWQQIKQYFSKSDPALLDDITRHSYAFHIWGGMTVSLQPEPNSLVWHILNEYTISNPAVAHGPF